jgi:integrase
VAPAVDVIGEMVDRRQAAAAALGIELSPDSYLFSPDPHGLRPLSPDMATQRFERMAKRLSIDATLHSLRHYTATELILAGVDARTVAGRLGHSGGGATTLRVYAAWISEATSARQSRCPDACLRAHDRARTEGLRSLVLSSLCSKARTLFIQTCL